MAQAWHRGAAVGFAQSIDGLSQPPEMQPRRAFVHRFWSYESDWLLEYDASQQGPTALSDLLSRTDGGIEKCHPKQCGDEPTLSNLISPCIRLESQRPEHTSTS